MGRLINDLLDGARVSTGKYRLERTVVDIASLIHLAVRTCTPAIEERRHHLAVSLQEGPIEVLGDRLRLVQVFDNLIGNACKYTLPGGRLTAHEGSVVAVSDRERGGSEFVVRLPLATVSHA